MENIQKLINTTNLKKTSTSNLSRTQDSSNKECNCKQKDLCPMNGKCLQTNIIYQASVTSNNNTETYIGLTETQFKTRYRNHTLSFRNEKYKNSTELSKHIWKLKEKGLAYNIQWNIINKAPPYNPISKVCNLCLTEKYYLTFKPDLSSLNKRSEISSACRHSSKYLLCNIK